MLEVEINHACGRGMSYRRQDNVDQVVECVDALEATNTTILFITIIIIIIVIIIKSTIITTITIIIIIVNDNDIVIIITITIINIIRQPTGTPAAARRWRRRAGTPSTSGRAGRSTLHVTVCSEVQCMYVYN